MSVRRVVAILVLAVLAVLMPSSASASITPTCSRGGAHDAALERISARPTSAGTPCEQGNLGDCRRWTDREVIAPATRP